MKTIFLKATESDWYPNFLNPVVETITACTWHNKILDIGTGPGTLPQLLIKKNPGLIIKGIDTDRLMILEARRRLSHKNVSYEFEKLNAPLEFDENQFDIVTFCSVLFLLGDGPKTHLLDEALRVLKPGGKILILTPTGRNSILSSFSEVRKYPFSISNFTFMIWKIATNSGGRRWQKQKWVKEYAEENQLTYKKSIIFNNNASLEEISSFNN